MYAKLREMYGPVCYGTVCSYLSRSSRARVLAVRAAGTLAGVTRTPLVDWLSTLQVRLAKLYSYQENPDTRFPHNLRENRVHLLLCARKSRKNGKCTRKSAETYPKIQEFT